MAQNAAPTDGGIHHNIRIVCLANEMKKTKEVNFAFD
jgi:hypothetical protein